MEKATALNISWKKVPASYGQVLMQKLWAGEAYDLIYPFLNERIQSFLVAGMNQP
ncbi:MAG: hypothetical protein JEY71_01220 [Sphaerochaeta sp.]|nr:hypothetical protein [Sphaerochaeta sp.]